MVHLQSNAECYPQSEQTTTSKNHPLCECVLPRICAFCIAFRLAKHRGRHRHSLHSLARASTSSQRCCCFQTGNKELNRNGNGAQCDNQKRNTVQRQRRTPLQILSFNCFATRRKSLCFVAFLNARYGTASFRVRILYLRPPPREGRTKELGKNTECDTIPKKRHTTHDIMDDSETTYDMIDDSLFFIKTPLRRFSVSKFRGSSLDPPFIRLNISLVACPSLAVSCP